MILKLERKCWITNMVETQVVDEEGGSYRDEHKESDP